MPSKDTAAQIWASLNVSSIAEELKQEQVTAFTNKPYTQIPCGTGVTSGQTRCVSNCTCAFEM